MRGAIKLSAVALAGLLSAAASASAQTPMPPAGNYNECRSQKIVAGLTGRARERAVEDCLRGPVAQGPAPRARQYNGPGEGDCRAAAIMSGVSPEVRDRFVGRCLNGTPSAASRVYSMH
jgi:hypothetical protein